MNQLYYESLERQQLEVRKLRHDMTNHLQTLAGLSGEEHKAYLDKLLDRPGIKIARTKKKNFSAGQE